METPVSTRTDAYGLNCRLAISRLFSFCLGASVAVLPACKQEQANSSTPPSSASAPAPSGTATETAYASIPDAKLASAIEESMARDLVLQSQPIHVSIANGEVLLFGTVPTLAAKWRAARLVGSFRGVMALIHGIRVNTPSLPDAKLAREVNDAIKSDPATRNASVQATANAATVMPWSNT